MYRVHQERFQEQGDAGHVEHDGHVHRPAMGPRREADRQPDTQQDTDDVLLHQRASLGGGDVITDPGAIMLYDIIVGAAPALLILGAIGLAKQIWR